MVEFFGFYKNYFRLNWNLRIIYRVQYLLCICIEKRNKRIENNEFNLFIISFTYLNMKIHMQEEMIFQTMKIENISINFKSQKMCVYLNVFVHKTKIVAIMHVHLKSISNQLTIWPNPYFSCLLSKILSFPLFSSSFSKSTIHCIYVVLSNYSGIFFYLILYYQNKVAKWTWLYFSTFVI